MPLKQKCRCIWGHGLPISESTSRNTITLLSHNMQFDFSVRSKAQRYRKQCSIPKGNPFAMS